MRWIVFLYPWLELWSLLALGSRTSAGIALLWVLGAGVLGVMLIRVAGAQTLGQLRAAQQSGQLAGAVAARQCGAGDRGPALVDPRDGV